VSTCHNGSVDEGVSQGMNMNEGVSAVVSEVVSARVRIPMAISMAIPMVIPMAMTMVIPMALHVIKLLSHLITTFSPCRQSTPVGVQSLVTTILTPLPSLAVRTNAGGAQELSWMSSC